MAELRSVASTARPAILIPAWILDTPPSAAGTSSAVNCPAATSGASVERRPNHEDCVDDVASERRHPPPPNMVVSTMSCDICPLCGELTHLAPDQFLNSDLIVIQQWGKSTCAVELGKGADLALRKHLLQRPRYLNLRGGYQRI